MSLAVLMVSYNSRATLPAALASVAAADEVVVVDNASPDGTGAWLRQTAPPGCTVVCAEENLGFSRAVNLAAQRCRSELLLLLNPDAYLLPGVAAALPRRFARLAARWGAWAVGLGQRDAAGGLQLAFGAQPTLAAELVRRGVQRRLDAPHPATAARAAQWVQRYAPAPRRVAWVAGSSLLVRRDAFARVGGFDPGYFLYFEDIDFCLRLRRAGGQVVFDPAPTVVHHRGRSMAQAPALARRAYRQSQARMARTHLGPVQGTLTRAWAWWRGRADA